MPSGFPGYGYSDSFSRVVGEGPSDPGGFTVCTVCGAPMGGGTCRAAGRRATPARAPPSPVGPSLGGAALGGAALARPFVLGEPAPDPCGFPRLQRVRTALMGDGAPGTDLAGGFLVRQCRTGLPYREEELGIRVRAGSLAHPFLVKRQHIHAPPGAPHRRDETVRRQSDGRGGRDGAGSAQVVPRVVPKSCGASPPPGNRRHTSGTPPPAGPPAGQERPFTACTCLPHSLPHRTPFLTRASPSPCGRRHACGPPSRRTDRARRSWCRTRRRGEDVWAPSPRPPSAPWPSPQAG